MFSWRLVFLLEVSKPENDGGTIFGLRLAEEGRKTQKSVIHITWETWEAEVIKCFYAVKERAEINDCSGVYMTWAKNKCSKFSSKLCPMLARLDGQLKYLFLFLIPNSRVGKVNSSCTSFHLRYPRLVFRSSFIFVWTFPIFRRAVGVVKIEATGD
jgi:hypothetical protein